MKIKKYEIILEETDEAMVNIHRKNTGFSAWELLGLLDRSRHEIMKQLDGDLSTKVTREVIVSDEEMRDIKNNPDHINIKGE